MPPVVTISFSPQNYTVNEGSSVDLMIVADKVSPEDIMVTVTTMNITAECEQQTANLSVNNDNFIGIC